VKKDLQRGRLLCSKADAVELCAYIVQCMSVQGFYFTRDTCSVCMAVPIYYGLIFSLEWMLSSEKGKASPEALMGMKCYRLHFLSLGV